MININISIKKNFTRLNRSYNMIINIKLIINWIEHKFRI